MTRPSLKENIHTLKVCWLLGWPDLSNIQLCMLLFGTVMYGYHMDQNPEDGIYSLNFEAGHRTFVKQWEMAQFTIGNSVLFFLIIFWTKNKSKWVIISPNYAGYNPLLGLWRTIYVLTKRCSKSLVFRFVQL